MNHPHASRTLMLAAAVLAGCATPGLAIDPQARANAAVDPPAAPADADFPTLDSARWKQGSFPSLDALRRMGPGMGKDQVRELLSWPHFSEGLVGDRTWNYIFHFRTGADVLRCQYMVRFNDDLLTDGVFWKGPRCADLLKPVPVAAAAVRRQAS